MKKILLPALLALFTWQGVAAETNYGYKTEVKDTVEKKKEKPSAYEKLIKEGGSVTEGMCTVRHIKNNWYFEVPDSLMGRLMLAVTRFRAVPQGFKKLTGEQVNSSIVYWEQHNEKTLFLREYVQSQFAPEKDNIAKALKQSTVDPIIFRFDVIGRNPETKAQLIDVSKIITADNKLFGLTQADRSQLSVSSLASDRTFTDTIKTFPINMEIVTMRTYNASAGKIRASQSGAVTIKLNTSIVMLPKEPMRPRFADERVGYFQNSITEFSDEQQVTKQRAIVQRYRLEPKDPERYRKGQLCEPKKQIVYYIDPATPKKWVPYLIAGINDWNKAFEKAGFKNAITAKEWPQDTDMDIDDARYSVIRYLPSETENAYGPRIVDPRSGEIMESHVCWYHNVMNLLKKWYMVQCGPMDKRARTMTFSDELMGNLIRFVSSHEVGHSIGLRHNMIASSATPVEKLRDKAWVEANGHTVSIMDYARFNYVAQPEDGISQKGLFPRIGDYDKWAIHWGYQYRPDFKDEFKEQEALRTEVSQRLKADHRLMYVGDEGRGMDPRSQSEDLGDNNMKANEYGIKNLKRVMENILTWTAQPDYQYDDLTSIYGAVRQQYQRYTMHVQKNIGGRYKNTIPGMRPTDAVPRSLQKEAIEWLGRNVFDAPLWLYPENVTEKTGVRPVEDIRNRQNATLSVLLNPVMLYNICSSAQDASEPYALDEYLNDVFSAVWKPINGSDTKNDYFRRQQERNYISLLEKALKPEEKSKLLPIGDTVLRSDVPLYVEMHLEKIHQYVDSHITTDKANDVNAQHYIHLKKMLGNIEKTK